ncbi:GNAT family N-acetyltransferase [Bacillus spongiae]|uniref:GNAT family N-acetyltransferase n=1 Tax=Bacillus spongiae TaxID=2683610 RepID=A0ABU8HF14_9BACI
MDIYIDRLTARDTEELYTFECLNRSFFEELVPSRGEDYYQYQNFKIRHTELLAEQEKNSSYFFLIKNNTDKIVGRMNLVDIDQHKNEASVGYRIGKEFTGKGVASKALQLLVEQIRNSSIEKVKAKTTTNNISSQKVLEKNGFNYLRLSDETIEWNGQNVKLKYYVLYV